MSTRTVRTILKTNNMGNHGANRLPDEIKALKGTLKPHRTQRDKPAVDLEPIPEAPEQMEDLERHYWDRFKRAVEPLRVFTGGDREAFEMLVMSRAHFERVRKSEDLDTKRFIAASAEVRKWLTVWGLTPQSRATLKMVAPPEVTDELEEFLKN